MTRREPVPFNLEETQQACFAQLRGAISNDVEWLKHLDWAAGRLQRDSGTGSFTSAERVYLDALAVAGVQKNDIPGVRRILDGAMRQDSEDFFLLCLDMKLSNLLGVESNSRDRVEHLLDVPQTQLDVPGFEFLPPFSLCSKDGEMKGYGDSAPPRGEGVPQLSIAVSTWNRRSSLAILIESVRRNTRSPYELIVYDNQSSDGTADYLRALQNEFPELGVVCSNGHRRPERQTLHGQPCPRSCACERSGDRAGRDGAWIVGAAVPGPHKGDGTHSRRFHGGLALFPRRPSPPVQMVGLADRAVQRVALDYERGSTDSSAERTVRMCPGVCVAIREVRRRAVPIGTVG